MQLKRRDAMKKSLAVAGFLAQYLGHLDEANAYAQNAFNASSISELYKSLGLGLPTQSALITLNTPEIAENGAVVQVSANTTLNGLKRWLFIVEKNPIPLVAIFNLSDDISPAVTLRCKFAQTSEFLALAHLNDGRLLYASKEVKVTLGGCGG
jgi:sulfur-oxidizing protein SoxY